MSPLVSSVLNRSGIPNQWGNWNGTNTNLPVWLFTELPLEIPLRFQYQILFGWQTLKLHSYIAMNIIPCSTWLKNEIWSHVTTIKWIYSNKIINILAMHLLWPWSRRGAAVPSAMEQKRGRGRRAGRTEGHIRGGRGMVAGEDGGAWHKGAGRADPWPLPTSMAGCGSVGRRRGVGEEGKDRGGGHLCRRRTPWWLPPPPTC